MADNSQPQSLKFTFSLIRLKAECRVPPTFADFTPPFVTLTSFRSVAPTFNGDNCSNTPAFILPSDQKTQGFGLNAVKLQFENRVREALLSMDKGQDDGSSVEIEEMTPSSRYCQICQEYFKNYGEHLDQKSHALRLQNNEFNQHMEELCVLVKKQQCTQICPDKRKLIKKKAKRQLANAIKSSPKTRVSSTPKRQSSQNSLLSWQKQQFEL